MSNEGKIGQEVETAIEEEDVGNDSIIEEYVEEDVGNDSVIEELIEEEDLTEVEVVSDSEGEMIEEEVIDDRFEDVHRMPTVVEEDSASTSLDIIDSEKKNPSRHSVGTAGNLLDDIRRLSAGYEDDVTSLTTTAIPVHSGTDTKDESAEQQHHQQSAQPRIPGKKSSDDYWARALSVKTKPGEGIQKQQSPRAPGKEALDDWDIALSLISRSAVNQDSGVTGSSALPEVPTLPSFSNPIRDEAARAPASVGENAPRFSGSGQRVSRERITDDGIGVYDDDDNFHANEQAASATNLNNGIRIYDHDPHPDEQQEAKNEVVDDGIRIYDYDLNENKQGASNEMTGDGIRIYDYDVDGNDQTMNNTINRDGRRTNPDGANENEQRSRESIRVFPEDANANEQTTDNKLHRDSVRVFPEDANENEQTTDNIRHRDSIRVYPDADNMNETSDEGRTDDLGRNVDADESNDDYQRLGGNDDRVSSSYAFRAKPKASKTSDNTHPGNEIPVHEEKVDDRESEILDDEYNSSYAFKAKPRSDKMVRNNTSATTPFEEGDCDRHDNGMDDGRLNALSADTAQQESLGNIPQARDVAANRGMDGINFSGTHDDKWNSSYAFKAKPRADHVLQNTSPAGEIPADERKDDVHDSEGAGSRLRSWFPFKSKPKADEAEDSAPTTSEIDQGSLPHTAFDESEVPDNDLVQGEMESSQSLTEMHQTENENSDPNTAHSPQSANDSDAYNNASTIGPLPFGDVTEKLFDESTAKEIEKNEDEDASYQPDDLIEKVEKVPPKAVSLGFHASRHYNAVDDDSSSETMQMLSLEEQSAEFLVLPGLGADFNDSNFLSTGSDLMPGTPDEQGGNEASKRDTREISTQPYTGIDNEDLTDNTNDDDYKKRLQDANYLHSLENGDRYGDNKSDDSNRRMKCFLCLQCCAVLIILLAVLLWLFVFRNDEGNDKDIVVPYDNFTLNPAIPTLPARPVRPAVVPTVMPTEPPISTTRIPTLRPTQAASTKIPTLPPSQAMNNTSSQTNMPTMTANDTIQRWQQTGYFVSPSTQVLSYGTTVSVGTTQMAVGAPLALENGVVFTYKKINDTWIQNVTTSQLFGVQPDGRFGAALDMTDEILVVGAPNVFARGTTTQVGAVYVYGHYGTLVTPDGWAQIGRTLQGDSGVYGAYEEFGSSVAVSDNNRVILVGAPGSSVEDVSKRGRIYSFRLDGSGNDWELMHDVFGSVANGSLGAAVDASVDGSLFIAGAPGAGSGYATMYRWNSSSWESISQFQGDSLGERFGSSVKILAPDASSFAVGAPNYNGDQGKVVVFANENGGYVQLGQAIVGLSGEYLGSLNMISSVPSSGLSLVLGSLTGVIKRYDFDAGSGDWIQVGKFSKESSSFSQISNSPYSPMVVVGANEEALIYELK